MPVEDTNIEKLKKELPAIDWTSCSVGMCEGPGLMLGYDGWGTPHVRLDPAIPLDAQIRSMGLDGAFAKVKSRGLLHMLHGDCTLTHGVRGLCAMTAPGGKLEISYFSLPEAVRMALRMLDAGDFASAQAIEKLCFRPPLDSSRILFPQTMINKNKLQSLLSNSGVNLTAFEERDRTGFQGIFPDSHRLDGIEDKVWETSSKNFSMEESLRQDRPTCVICDRVATKRDHDRRYFSRYCKDHYQEARKLCDRSLESMFEVVARARKPGKDSHAVKD